MSKRPSKRRHDTFTISIDESAGGPYYSDGIVAAGGELRTRALFVAPRFVGPARTVNNGLALVPRKRKAK